MSIESSATADVPTTGVAPSLGPIRGDARRQLTCILGLGDNFNVDSMDLCLVALEEIFVAEFLLAQLTVSLEVDNASRLITCARVLTRGFIYTKL